MGKVKVLARNWVIEIDTDPLATVPTGADVWTKVGGVNTFTISNDKEDADTTDFDSQGFSESFVASRSNELSFEGFFLEDLLDGTRDPGQEAIEKYGELIGPESIARVRITPPSGKNAKIYSGSFAVGDVGGGTNDPTSWGASMTVSGKPEKITI